MAERLYRVTMPHFCAGLIARETEGAWRVDRAAPILWWSVGKPIPGLMVWANRKGGSVQLVSEH